MDCDWFFDSRWKVIPERNYPNKKNSSYNAVFALNKFNAYPMESFSEWQFEEILKTEIDVTCRDLKHKNKIPSNYSSPQRKKVEDNFGAAHKTMRLDPLPISSQAFWKLTVQYSLPTAWRTGLNTMWTNQSITQCIAVAYRNSKSKFGEHIFTITRHCNAVNSPENYYKRNL